MSASRTAYGHRLKIDGNLFLSCEDLRSCWVTTYVWGDTWKNEGRIRPQGLVPD
jgi:hypothetical protein